MTDADVVRDYYRALDDDEYDLLESVLDPAFVQVRPDRTLEGRDRFVRFMREERPQQDTEHALDALYARLGDDSEERREVVARGRLLDADGTPLFGFVDVFRIADGAITRLATYTD